MNLRRLFAPQLPPELRERTTPGGGGRIWRLVVGALTALGLGSLVASIVWAPTKRNIEVLAGLIFLGFALAADPFKALLFAIIVVPYPAYTSVGSTSMLLILAVAGLVMMKSRQLHLPSPFVRKDADLAVMGWGLMVALSLYNQPSGVEREVRIMLVGFVSAVVLYYLVIYLTHDLHRIWQSIVVSQLVVDSLAILGMFQWLLPDKQILPAFFSFSRKVASYEEIRRGQVRVSATFDGQELFAEYLAISIVIQYFLFRRAHGLAAKTFWAFSILLVLACLFATATRGAFLILVGGFIYLLVFGKPAVPRSDILKLMFLGVALFYLSLGLIDPLVTHMMDRIENIGSDDSSIQGRSVVMRQAIEGVGESPFLGHGIVTPEGTFRGFVTRNIHSLYLTLAYTIGLPGLIAFVWFLVVLYRISAATFRDQSISQSHRELALCLNTALVMFCVDQVKIEYTRQPLYMHLVWLLFAWIVCSWRAGQRERFSMDQYSEAPVR